MATHELLVDEWGSGERLDVWLSQELEGLSRTAAQKLITSGNVFLNGASCTSKSCRIELGDRLLVSVDDARDREGDATLAPTAIPLDVRYEEGGVVVLSKQAGLVCHPSPGHEDDTLANALVARYGAHHLGTLQGEERPGIVHRLDRDTTGLMLAAKSDEAQGALQDLIRLRELDRRYAVLVQGYVAPETGLIDVGIARSRRDRQRMVASDGERAREAITTFTTLERFDAGAKDDGYSLLECHLYTGRTHQIRVHMAHVNHPVVGDPVYGQGDARKNLGLARQFLHSWRLSFDNPETGERLSFADALPEDLARVLGSLADRSLGRTEKGELLVPALLGDGDALEEVVALGLEGEDERV